MRKERMKVRIIDAIDQVRARCSAEKPDEKLRGIVTGQFAFQLLRIKAAEQRLVKVTDPFQIHPLGRIAASGKKFPRPPFEMIAISGFRNMVGSPGHHATERKRGMPIT